MRPRTTRIHVWRALLALWLCSASTSMAYDDTCPEDCGQVLKACLDEKADRHICMAVADECLTTCRTKLKNTEVQDQIDQPSAAVMSENTKTFQRNDLLGVWYGERQQDGSIVKWLTHRDFDGTYADIFLVCKDGVPDSIQREFGNWDYTNGIYRTITRIIEDMDGRRQLDTAEETYVETYRAIFLNELAFTYIHTTKDTTYSVLKVDDSYRVDCN
jgi:hypothetical protein